MLVELEPVDYNGHCYQWSVRIRTADTGLIMRKWIDDNRMVAIVSFGFVYFIDYDDAVLFMVKFL